jgi:SHS2 domain-containing protein
MALTGDAPAFEILEHTADIGLRARGRTVQELFENAAWGLAEILDRSARAAATVWEKPGRQLDLEAGDLDGLLVSWMDELLYLLQERDRCLAGVLVRAVDSPRLQAEVHLAPCARPAEGTELKAATYHQLATGEEGEGRWATVYFDV